LREDELVQFHPADAAQKAFSVAKIEHPEVMDENGRQKVGGLMDPKMGSMSPQFHGLSSHSACRAHTRVSD
jgi:DNA-directed RNA polymerase beta' subunit